METDLQLSEFKIDTTALRNASTTELLDALKKSLRATAEQLMQLGLIWRELEKRGVDLSPFRRGIASYIPLIASSQVIPEAVIEFAGNQTILKHITALPLEEQRRLCRGEPIDVVLLEGGELKVVPMPAQSLNTAYAKIVFAQNRIRTVSEQRTLLSTAAITHPKPKPIKRVKLPTDTQELLREIRSVICETEAGQEAVGVHMTKEQKDALRRHAESMGLPIATLVRGILLIHGFLD